MRVMIIAVGSRGDCQPYVALGCGLARAGHVVTVASHENFRELVTRRGLSFSPIVGDPQAILDSADPWLATGRPWDAIPAARALAREVWPLFGDLANDYWRVTQGSEFLIYSPVAGAAWSVAERLGIPAVQALLQPLHRTRSFPMIRVPTRPPLGGAFNAATHDLTQDLVWRLIRRPINQWRRDALDLPLAPSRGPFAEAEGARVPDPSIYGFSPLVVPKPPDWGPDIHVTGYWTLPTDPTWRAPDPLLEFLAAGPPPVYVGFGSMTPNRAEPLTAVALEALARTGQRGVLSSGWGSFGAGELPSSVIAVRDVPHEWLLPQMRAVVHHGGAGTTGAALRAGVPSILLPLGFDQPYWAERVRALGVGPRPIPRRKLSVDRLSIAVDQAVQDGAMRRRAAQLGTALRTERGVEAAVAIIDAVASRWRVQHGMRR